MDIVALVLKQGGLPGYDLQIVVDTVLVTNSKEVERLLRGRGSVVLLPRLDFEVVQGIQIILNLLEGRERGLPVCSNGVVILRNGILDVARRRPWS